MAKKTYLDKEGLLYYNEKLKNILNTKADSTTVNNQISTLDTKIETTKTSLEGTIATTKTELEGTINTTKVALEGSINTTNTNLNTLKTNTETSIGNLETKDAEHDASISTLEAKDTAHDTDIAGLKAKDTAHDTAIANLVTKDTELDTDITNLQTRDTQHDAAISNLNSVKADKTAVTQEIANAIAGVTQFNYEVVDELPETGIKGTIYLVLYSQSHEGDVYQEFIWIAGEPEGHFESLGYTNEIDLSNYVTFDDTITNGEIDAMFPVARFDLTLKYLDSFESNTNEHNVGIANQGVTFNEEFFNISDPMHVIPTSENFIIKIKLNDNEAIIPNDITRIDTNNENALMFGFNQEVQNIIIENGGKLQGITFDMTIPADAMLLNGVGNKERNIVFVYGQPLDGSEYPADGE